MGQLVGLFTPPVLKKQWWSSELWIFRWNRQGLCLCHQFDAARGGGATPPNHTEFRGRGGRRTNSE